MFNRKIVVSFIALFLLTMLAGNPAFAMDKNILNEKNTVMPANEKVDNVIVIGHDIDIKGKVDISAIVINGNLHISKTARINGLVLVLNGSVVQDPGSYVKENILAFKFRSETLNHLLLGGALLLGTWLLRFALSVCFVLMSVLIGLLLKQKGARSLSLMKQQPGKLFLIGAIACFALAGVILLLVITIIGLPFAIILVAPPVVAFIIGLAMISQAVGEKLIPGTNAPKWVAIFAGSFLLISVFNFPFFGWIVLLGVFCISNGLMLIWMNERVVKRRRLKG